MTQTIDSLTAQMQRVWTPWLEATADFEQGKRLTTGKSCEVDSAFHHANVLPYIMAENSHR